MGAQGASQRGGLRPGQKAAGAANPFAEAAAGGAASPGRHRHSTLSLAAIDGRSFGICAVIFADIAITLCQNDSVLAMPRRLARLGRRL